LNYFCAAILDIKPYSPHSDCQPNIRVPEWLVASQTLAPIPVTIAPTVESMLLTDERIHSKLTLYRKTPALLLELVKEVLTHDIRRHNNTSNLHSVLLDGLRFSYEMREREGGGGDSVVYVIAAEQEKAQDKQAHQDGESLAEEERGE
jgi:hypothetical protein